MPTYLLGIDNGGTIAKAALFTLDGREVAVASRKTEMITPQPGHTERDMDSLWQATAGAIRAVIEQSRIAPGEIAAVATAGHGNGLYLVDQDGRPVRNGIISTDSRAKDYVARWYRDGVDRQVLPHTMQSLWPAQPNAILAWLRDHEPETIRRAGWVLMVKDYIRFRLCGAICTELTDMSATSLMSVRDRDYHPEVLEAFGLAEMRRLLPPIKRPEEICGRVTAQAAAETGLKEGTPVAGGLFDAAACVLASGVIDEAPMCVIAGTWSVNQYVSKTPVVSEEVFMTSLYCTPGYHMILEASATSASNLEWFVTQFFQAERETAEKTGRSVYQLCNDLVAQSRPEGAKIVFLPFLFGSNVDADAKACFVGLNGWHSRGDVLRAIYEGVAFGHKAHVDRLLRFRGPAKTIRLAGGAAHSGVWAQIFADTFQLPVEITAGTELGALGAAMTAGIAAGCFADYREAVQAMVKIAQVFPPNPTLADLYKEKYHRYQAVLEALKPVWKELA
jgi:L-xylulokinase